MFLCLYACLCLCGCKCQCMFVCVCELCALTNCIWRSRRGGEWNSRRVSDRRQQRIESSLVQEMWLKVLQHAKGAETFYLHDLH